MAVVPFKSYPKADENQAWSFVAADGNALIDRGGMNLYKMVHTWFDSEKADIRGSYKLPHHKIIDGQVKTVWRGVAAAMAILYGARGGVNIPLGDKKGVYNHLAKHYKEFDKEVPKAPAGMSELELLRTRVKILEDTRL